MNELNFFERNARYIVLIAVVIGAFSGNFARLTDAPPMVIGFYRLLFSLPFFIAVDAFSRRKERRPFKVSKKEALFSFLAAAGLYGHYMCWFAAVKMTNMAAAATLESLHPLTVLIVSLLFFHRKVGWKAVLGIIIALTGGVIASGNGLSFSGAELAGDLLAFASGVSLAFYFIFSKHIRSRGMGANTFVLTCFSICCALFFFTMIATGTPFGGYRPVDFAYILGMALLCQIGAHALISWALGYVSDLYVSTWQTFEGVVTIIIAFFIFKEAPAPVQIAGCIVAFGGLLLYNLDAQVDWDDGSGRG